MDIIHLFVELCSDGTMLSYNKDRTLNRTFTDLTSWSKLSTVYNLSQLTSDKRKGIDSELNIKYVQYTFKNTKTGMYIEIPPEHIKNIISNISVG